ncbi:hypothetical protein Hdeb2414_s0002g00046651 [Helianthus debilis subsp. tardiflorus]
MLVMITFIYYGYGLLFFFFYMQTFSSFEKLPKQNSISRILSLCIYDYNKHTHLSFSKFYSIVKLSSRGDSSIFQVSFFICLKTCSRTPHLLPLFFEPATGKAPVELQPRAPTTHKHPATLTSPRPLLSRFQVRRNTGGADK